MPTYQYACTACGERLEAVQSFSDSALTECPACSGRLRKVFSAVGVVFKGSGFYRNDSRDTPKKDEAGKKESVTASASSSESSGGSGGSSGSDASSRKGEGSGSGRQGGKDSGSGSGSSGSGGSGSGGSGSRGGSSDGGARRTHPSRGSAPARSKTA